MLYQEKHSKFIQNGYEVIKTLQNKAFLVNEIFKLNTINSLNNITVKYNKTLFPFYINLGLQAFSEIKRDLLLNPLSKNTDEQIKKIDKKHFLMVGLTCLVLSGVTLEYKINNTNVPNFLNIDLHINFKNPNPNPTEQIAQSLQPKFMTSIFHSKLEAFTKLLDMTEGKSNFFYKDNLGIATAYGWNPTKNSKSFNVEVAQKIGMTTLQVKAIEKISDNSKIQSVPTSLKKVVLSDKQVKKSAEIMMGVYEKEFLKVMKIKARKNNKDYTKVLKFYHDLPNNQQAVMVHMAYKVGITNLLKYDIFFKNLFTYMEKPTNLNLINLTDNFDYSFKTRKGNRLSDTRVEQAHNKFFNECSLKESDKTHKTSVNERVQSCRQLVASKTIKITNKG